MAKNFYVQTEGRRTKRVLVLADSQCGHRSGLTPPEWGLNPANPHDRKWAGLQRAQWNWFHRKITQWQPYWLLLYLGDAVDGKSERACGRDAIRLQREEQTQMVEQIINLINPRSTEMVYGTRYHVRDWEDEIARMVGAKIGAHGWPEVSGVIFDIKHKIGSSTIPHGRMTPLLRSRLWNELWVARNRQPNANILLRAHVHYFMQYSDAHSFMATCPALQGVGTEYGAEQCEGLIDYGFLTFDIKPSGSWTWQSHLAELPQARAQTSKY